MNIDALTALISDFDLIADRYNMYITNDDNVDSAENYINGYCAAAFALGVRYSREVKLQVIKSRGWEGFATGIVPQMINAGMTNPEIITALFEIEKACWLTLLQDEKMIGDKAEGLPKGHG